MVEICSKSRSVTWFRWISLSYFPQLKFKYKLYSFWTFIGLLNLIRVHISPNQDSKKFLKKRKWNKWTRSILKISLKKKYDIKKKPSLLAKMLLNVIKISQRPCRFISDLLVRHINFSSRLKYLFILKRRY